MVPGFYFLAPLLVSNCELALYVSLQSTAHWTGITRPCQPEETRDHYSEICSLTSATIPQ